MLNLAQHPHRRRNMLTGEWVLVSPHRTQRPWQGQVEKTDPEKKPAYDPECYLCPGNARAGGVRNPQYTQTFVFENDFAALRSDTPPESWQSGDDLLVAKGEPGICRVVCFSPRHDLTLAEIPQEGMRHVVDVWVDQYSDLGSKPFINSVVIFENRGQMMGASNPHPHGQIWSNCTLPNELVKEQHALDAHWQAHGRTLLSDYLALELKREERIVCANDSFVALVPFWAFWPFETIIVSREQRTAIDQLTDEEREGLAAILRELTGRYDRLFHVTFPYSMGFHQRPTDGAPHPEWHVHAHFYPPLLRSATVRKHVVGYELLANEQRDITPELAAARLRKV